MNFGTAEDTIRAHIEAQWALSAHASVPLLFSNEDKGYDPDRFVFVEIQGTFADKSVYGSVGKRSSVEGGIVFFHAFTEKSVGKSLARSYVLTMTSILELQVLSLVIDLEGGMPPSPVEDDALVSNEQPRGNYYRCSGSVPFTVRSGI